MMADRGPLRLQSVTHSMTAAATPAKTRRPLMKFWYAYIGAFLAIWVVLMFGFGFAPEVIKQWPMSLVMILGSLVAGSTPMGGGAVSFPFLVLWLGIPPHIARDFGLVIQALGMTSAMIFILCRRTPIQGRVLLWTIAGAAAGMLVGTVAIAPRVPPNFVKLTFACMWMSFALLTIAKNREFCSITGVRFIDSWTAARTGLCVGLLGGAVASIIGLGVEMALYTVLVLLYRCDLKIAVPTAVSGMAVTSVMGVAVHLWVGDIPRDVTMKFLAAGPLVIFGAPIGTYIVSVIPRIRTLYVVSFLCVLQFFWTLKSLERTRAEWIFVALAMTLATAVFYFMYRRGRRAQ
jgi:uncharacterized membrane protein YfcA